MATNNPDLNAPAPPGTWQPPSMTGDQFNDLFQWNPVTQEYEIRPGKSLPPGATGFDPKTGVVAYANGGTPTPPAGTPTNNPAPPGPPGPGDFPPFNGPFNSPPNLNQGGGTGLEYIPPVPQFGAPDFHAPNAADVLKDPGYQFRLGQGEQALEQSAAARGVLNTGGTLKDLIGYGQNFASQEYGNVYDRSERAYNLAYRGAQDEFAPLMHQYDTLSAAGQHQNDLNYQHSWDKWVEDYNMFRNNNNDRFDRLYRTSTA